MLKRLRENRKSKKGFTLVELIVVIVIILVLAAVMVPSVTKYVAKANQANCKSDAASLLVQLQADVAEHYSDEKKATVAFKFVDVGDIKLSSTAIASVTANSKSYHAEEKDGDITSFQYQNGKYYITWTPGAGWVGSWENTTSTD